MFLYFTLAAMVVGLFTRPAEFQESVPAGQDGFQMPIPAEKSSEGWIAAWDGASDFGWRNSRHTKIENGIWKLPQESSVVRTSAEFCHYQMVVVYRLESDSEAMLLCNTNPSARQPGKDHTAIVLEPTDGHWAALSVSSTADGVMAWNWSDENLEFQEPVAETKRQGPKRGYVGFRVSDGGLSIRQLWIRPLLQTPSLTSDRIFWDPRGLGEAEWSIEANEMTLRGGPGYLTLANQLPGNFALQFQAKASAATNSGVFFRCIPGEAMNGYEAQINNQFLEEDRRQPADCGTGGIFRRTDARRVVASADQWFTETMIVNGNQISVWVDGYQVTDWSDQREPHRNPRKGQRRASGELQIQAHDPEVDIQLRELRLKEFPNGR